MHEIKHYKLHSATTGAKYGDPIAYESLVFENLERQLVLFGIFTKKRSDILYIERKLIELYVFVVNKSSFRCARGCSRSHDLQNPDQNFPKGKNSESMTSL